MKSKILMAVEYFSIKDDETKTFEIFETIQEAYRFGMGLESWQKKSFFIADFNKDSIFREKEGGLNYEDNSGLYGYFTPINFNK